LLREPPSSACRTTFVDRDENGPRTLLYPRVTSDAPSVAVSELFRCALTKQNSSQLLLLLFEDRIERLTLNPFFHFRNFNSVYRRFLADFDGDEILLKQIIIRPKP